MGAITKTFTFSSGTRILATEVNTDYDTIYNEFNGNIENANIKSNAAIIGTKLDLTSVGAIGTTIAGGGTFTNLVTTAASNLSGTNISNLTAGGFVVSGITNLSGTNVSNLSAGSFVVSGVTNLSGTNVSNLTCSGAATFSSNISAANIVCLGTSSNGTLYAGDGSAAAPSIAQASDPHNGIYFGVNQFIISCGGTVRAYWTTVGGATVGNFDPTGAGTANLGNASDYWGDISYKTLTDRGCLGSFDDGVELRDGTKVTDVEALFKIKKHPFKQTIYNAPMLDYRTFPKAAYKPADKNGELSPRNEFDEPVQGADGIEMTSMFSIMIGAIKELTMRIKKLEET